MYLKIDDGNADDKSVFVERLKEFKNQWTFDGICVADSALYTAENLSAMAGMKWITRVPLSIKEAQNKRQLAYDAEGDRTHHHMPVASRTDQVAIASRMV